MYSLIIALSLFVAINGLNTNISRCVSSDTPLDIIFMVDSSGSVFDDEYNNWQYELDLVYDIVENKIPSNSRVALIHFSGCGSDITFEQCQDEGRFEQIFHLPTYGSPNDFDAVLSTIDSIGSDDFLGGYTWTEEAFSLALREFTINSTANADKMIVLITDGEPYPLNEDHNPCQSSTGYLSPTVQSLRELGVAIVTVGIDIAEDVKEEYFDCISGSDFYFEGSFDSSSTSQATAAEVLSDSIGDFICSEYDLSGSINDITPTARATPIPSAETTPSPTVGNLQGLCDSTTQLDIVFMVDSSGSVYDAEFKNWQAELDLVNYFVNSLPGTTSRASLINFSGCGASFSLTECQEMGRMTTEFNLDTYGNDLELVSDAIDNMDATDFDGGFTWTEEAFHLALNQFNTYSDSDKTKIIVLLTDGEPFPYDEGHEPCITSTNYGSATLTALNELNVDIITIGIDISEEIKEEKLDCVSDSYFGVSHFGALQSLSVEISSLICDDINGDFTTFTPTPTSSGKATDGTITSDGIMTSIYINFAFLSLFITIILF